MLFKKPIRPEKSLFRIVAKNSPTTDFYHSDNGDEADIKLAHSELNKYKYSFFTPG